MEASCIPRLRWSSWNHRRCSRWSRHERTGCPSASEVCSHADVQPLPRPPLRRNWQSRQGDEGRAVVHSRGLELRRASGTSSLERANRSRGVQCGKSLPAVFGVLMFYTFNSYPRVTGSMTESSPNKSHLCPIDAALQMRGGHSGLRGGVAVDSHTDVSACVSDSLFGFRCG